MSRPFFILLSSCSFLTAEVSDRADVIFFGGDILTMNGLAPTAESVAVRNGKILTVGKKSDTMKWKGDQTELVDLKGGTLLPGFIAFKHFSEQLQDSSKGQALELAKNYAKYGFTTVTDLSMNGSIDTLKAIAEEENSPIRLQGYIPYDRLKDISDLQKDNLGKFKILGVKIEGADPALAQSVLDARKSNVQIAMSAKGDEGVATVLVAYENALNQYPKGDPRYLIEHGSITDVNLFHKMLQVKTTPSFTNQPVYYWEIACKERLLQECPTDFIDAAATAQKLGLKFSFSEDVSLSEGNPLLLMEIASIQETLSRSASNRRDRLTVDEAIKAMTIHAAWQTFREKELGTIEVGKQADFVLLSQNPKQQDTHKIKEIQVLATWISGKKVNL